VRIWLFPKSHEKNVEMARKGKSTEEIIGFLREAEVRIMQGENGG